MKSKLNTMISNSDVKLKRENFWYNYENQKKLLFNIASELFITTDMGADEAIDEAESFMDAFYIAKMNPDTRR